MISKRNIMKLESRKKIYNFIQKNPGIHLREISRQNNIPKTTLRHHLNYLNKQGRITVKSENRFKRYYASNKLGKKEKEILDVMMPIMSGWEIHRRLGENSKWKKIPVVFLTARLTETAEEVYQRYGIIRIKKPFDIKEFKVRIENILLDKQKYSKLMCQCHIF